MNEHEIIRILGLHNEVLTDLNSFLRSTVVENERRTTNLEKRVLQIELWIAKNSVRPDGAVFGGAGGGSKISMSSIFGSGGVGWNHEK